MRKLHHQSTTFETVRMPVKFKMSLSNRCLMWDCNLYTGGCKYLSDAKLREGSLPVETGGDKILLAEAVILCKPRCLCHMCMSRHSAIRLMYLLLAVVGVVVCLKRRHLSKLLQTLHNYR